MISSFHSILFHKCKELNSTVSALLLLSFCVHNITFECELDLCFVFFFVFHFSIYRWISTWCRLAWMDCMCGNYVSQNSFRFENNEIPWPRQMSVTPNFSFHKINTTKWNFMIADCRLPAATSDFRKQFHLGVPQLTPTDTTVHFDFLFDAFSHANRLGRPNDKYMQRSHPLDRKRAPFGRR